MTLALLPGEAVPTGHYLEVALKRVLALLAAFPLLAFPPAALAGGFSVYEMGTRATALGGAFTATADDPSALFYNPAGIAWLDQGVALSYNASFILPGTKFTLAEGVTRESFPGAVTSETKNNVFFPTGAYLTYRHNSRWSAGLGFFTPFGLGVEWKDPDSFAGRPISTNARITGYYLSPMVTYRPVPALAISAGTNFVITGITLERIRTQRFGTRTYNVADVRLEGSSTISVSPAAALLIRPNERFSFGINYKGGLTNSFEDQDATLTQRATGVESLDAAVSALLDDLGRTQDVSADLNYPSIVSVGVRVDAHEKVALMADFVWFHWSVFDRVVLRFTNPALNSVLEEHYQDGQQWRFGAQLALEPNVRLMAGLVRDNNPQPAGSVSPVLPDADRWDYSLGLSYAHKNFEITAAYMLVDFGERSTVENGAGRNFDGFDGAYDSIAQIPSIGVTYYFSSPNRWGRSAR